MCQIFFVTLLYCVRQLLYRVRRLLCTVLSVPSVFEQFHPIHIAILIMKNCDLYNADERTAVRSYTKGELAMLYSPRAKYESAIRMLNRYLHRCRGLLDELMALGYRPDDRRFTRPQVQVIFDYLGEP